MIAFLAYRNDHTCLFFRCSFKFQHNVTHPCQPTYSFFVQCLQHFWSDFVFTSSLSGSQSSYGCRHFCQCKKFLFPKINCIASVSGCCCLTGFNKSSKYSLHHKGFHSHLQRCSQLYP